MSSAAQAILAEWSLPIGITIAVILISAIYIRGWNALRKTQPEHFTGSRLLGFLTAMALLWLVVGSPLRGLAEMLISVHMTLNFVLMSVVPPLALLAAPVMPLWRGLPLWASKYLVDPLATRRRVRSFARFMTAPACAWITFNLIFVFWHIPQIYDFGMRHRHLHDLQQFSFLAGALLFWYPVLSPWPARPRLNGWLAVPYLIASDVVMTVMSALLAFCNRPVYAAHGMATNMFHISPMTDQIAAGVIMWVLNSTVLLTASMLIAMQMAGAGFGGRRSSRRIAGFRQSASGKPPQPSARVS
jgi:cytochrome c oxidase assembly factor CtaG